jgi:flavin-dependent dehydrogenase
MADHFGRQAVVIGGSLAGLMTARVLADHSYTLDSCRQPGLRLSADARGTSIRFGGKDSVFHGR